MSRKFLGILTVLLLLTPNFSQAEPPINTQPKPSVVIIDDILVPSMSQLKGRIVQEVCILPFPTCPNGEQFMEGRGASTIEQHYIDTYSLKHGTYMASTLLSTYNKANIIFIRTSGADVDGIYRYIDKNSMILGFEWALKNKDKYNIKAIATSLTDSSELLPNPNYCPQYPTFKETIYSLRASDIPVFAAAGNDGKRNQVNWPACVQGVYSISASSVLNKLEPYSNYDPLKSKYLVFGTAIVRGIDENIYRTWGTSISTQRAAAFYMKLKTERPDYKYYQVIARLSQKKAKDSIGTILLTYKNR